MREMLQAVTQGVKVPGDPWLFETQSVTFSPPDHEVKLFHAKTKKH